MLQSYLMLLATRVTKIKINCFVISAFCIFCSSSMLIHGSWLRFKKISSAFKKLCIFIRSYLVRGFNFNLITSIVAEQSYVEDTMITHLDAVKGSNTEEVYSRNVSLWGYGPLWAMSLSANTVLSKEAPKPADCWAFE